MFTLNKSYILHVHLSKRLFMLSTVYELKLHLEQELI